MKRLIYYIIPVLVALATFAGLWFSYESWGIERDYSDEYGLFKFVMRIIASALSVLAAYAYIVWMWWKHRKGRKFSFVQQVFLVMAIPFFLAVVLVEVATLIDTFLFLFASLLTAPLSLIISYVWIAKNKGENERFLYGIIPIIIIGLIILSVILWILTMPLQL